MSIGIIGSSDGPTMIFVSSDTWWKWLIVIGIIVIAVIGTVIFFIRRKRKK